MLMLARLAELALSSDPKTAMTAAGIWMEITGSDGRSQLAMEQRELDREKLELDWEKLHPKGPDLSKVDEMMLCMQAEAGSRNEAKSD